MRKVQLFQKRLSIRIKTLTKEQIKDYGRLIEKIVIAAAKEEGLDKDAIVCEDLGTLTNPVASVMKAFGLQDLRLRHQGGGASDRHTDAGQGRARLRA